MIQAKLYQIPCLETGKFALHAEQITAGLDERQLGNSSCGLELGLSLVELAQGEQGTETERSPASPCKRHARSDVKRVVGGSTKDTGSEVKWSGSDTYQWCNMNSVPSLLCLALYL